MTEINDIELHIPTEQYGFVLVRLTESSPEDVAKYYREYARAFEKAEGLPQKEWNDLLDTYRRDKGMPADMFPKLSERQSWLIHELDKSNTRLAKRASKTPITNIKS